MNCVGGPANAADEVAKTIVVVARPARDSRAARRERRERGTELLHGVAECGRSLRIFDEPNVIDRRTRSNLSVSKAQQAGSGQNCSFGA